MPLSSGESVIAHSVADLSAKMTWGYVTWHIHHVILHQAARGYDLSMVGGGGGKGAGTAGGEGHTAEGGAQLLVCMQSLAIG